jgi:hypothetical protein
VTEPTPGSGPIWTPDTSPSWPVDAPLPAIAPVIPVGGAKGQRQARLQSVLALVGAAALVGVAVISVAAATQPAGSNSSASAVLAAGASGSIGSSGATVGTGSSGTSGPSGTTGPRGGQGGRGFGRGPNGGPGAFGGPNGGPGGPGAFGGFGGPGGISAPGPGGIGPRGGIGGGAVTITTISGSQLSLKTADGWARTIDATGATIKRGTATITVADLAVGDAIAFRETRNTDGTFKITEIDVIQPQVDGTITIVGASSVTVSQPGGGTTVVQLTPSTSYATPGTGPNGTAATISALTVGARIHAVGTKAADGTFTATSIQVAPAQVAGSVTAKTATTITINDAKGTTSTIDVSGTTTYQSPKAASSSLSDVTVGGWVEAEGTLNADGSLAATIVRIMPGPGGPGGNGGSHPPFGGGFGGPRGGGPGSGPKATPAPSTTTN